MKHTIKPWMACLSLGIAMSWACSTDGVKEGPSVPSFPYDTVSILGDREFDRGLVRKRAETPSPGNIYPFGEKAAAPIWEIAEWGTKHELTEADRNVESAGSAGSVTYSNPGKSISFVKDGDRVGIDMQDRKSVV